MFILAIVFAIIIGYVLKGNLRNLEKIDIKNLYLVFCAFLIEAFIIFMIRKGLLAQGGITLILDIIMYSLLFIFAFSNRKNVYILIMCTGFLLNAVAIFANGGAMPVSSEAMKIVGITSNVSTEGLYNLVSGNTRFGILGDIIPFNFITHLAVSIGDIIAGIGLMLFIIAGMRPKNNIKNI